MKKFTLITIAALAALSAVSMAQEAGPAGGAPKGAHHGGGWQKMAAMHKAILAQLNLTPEQQTKMKALDEKRMSDMKAMRAEMKANPASPDIREKRKSMMKQYMEDLNAILTPAQQAKMKQLMKEAREKMKRDSQKGGTIPPSA